jgi:hypothetical protein
MENNAYYIIASVLFSMKMKQLTSKLTSGGAISRGSMDWGRILFILLGFFLCGSITD